MKITIDGTAQEIAALVVELQEQQLEENYKVTVKDLRVNDYVVIGS